MLRAAHQLFDGEPKVLLDEPAVRFVGAAAVDAMRQRRAELFAPETMYLRAQVVLRSRFAEDRLAAAVVRGVTQYVLLGAGGDTFGYRQPDWARQIRVFEVDHPASQAAKRARLAEAGIEIPPNVMFAPVDFERDSLRDRLEAGGVDLSAPILFSWLGVTMYLTEPAVDAVFETVVRLPRSSEIVYTFAQPRQPLDSPSERRSLADSSAAVGEPWLSYFTPEQLDAKLRRFGFSDVYFLTSDEARRRYFTGRNDGLSPGKRTSIGGAIV